MFVHRDHGISYWTKMRAWKPIMLNLSTKLYPDNDDVFSSKYSVFSKIFLGMRRGIRRQKEMGRIILLSV